MILKLNKILLQIIASSTQVFIAFFIWQNTENLQILLYFSLALFLSAPLGAFLANLTAVKTDPKNGLIIGNWIQIIEITVLLYLANNLNIDNVLIIGFLGGIAQSNKEATIRIIEILNNQTGMDNIEHFYANKALMIKLVEGIVPLFIAYLISITNSYQSLFAFVIVLLVLSSVTSTLMTTNTKKEHFHIKEIIKIPGTNPNKPALITSLLFQGITEGLTTTILPIIILIYIGSIVDWGWINIGTVAFSILITAIMSKTLTDAGSRGTYSLGAILFAIASIFLMINYNLIVVIVFLLAMSLVNVIKETSFNSSIERISSSDFSEEDLSTEYLFLIEIALSIGKILPIIALIIITTDIYNENFIKSIFLIIGFLPLITISMLAKTSVFANDPGVAENFKEGSKIKVPVPTT